MWYVELFFSFKGEWIASNASYSVVYIHMICSGIALHKLRLHNIKYFESLSGCLNNSPIAILS